MHDHDGRGGPARPPRRRWRLRLSGLVGAVLALAPTVAACAGGGGGGKSDGTRPR
jgi:hypothetical protein